MATMFPGQPSFLLLRLMVIFFLTALTVKVENHDHCVYDFVEVRDGHEDNSRLLGKYCGHRMPDDVKSTTNKMYVKFVSDASVQKGGFAAVFVKGRCTQWR